MILMILICVMIIDIIINDSNDMKYYNNVM